MKKIVSWSAIILLAVAVYLNVFFTLGKLDNKQESSASAPLTKEQTEVKQNLETIQLKTNVEPSSILSW